MSNIFEGILKERVVVIGIGNILRGDDSFGPKVIEAISGKVDAVCIDVGSAPENYIGKIAKERPNTILMIDAIDLGKKPGEYELLAKDDIIHSGFSTHDLSPRMFIEFLEKETNADIYLLGVQPESISLGSPMSKNLNQTLKEVSDLIVEADQCTKPIL